MFEKLIVAMKVPDSVEKDYWKQTVRTNRKILVLLASVTTLAQLFNIYRIFFVSESKLGTLNNCIYFFFYCSMLAACISYLVIDRCFRNNIPVLKIVQGAGMTFWLFWGMGINYYDIYKGLISEGNIILATALLGAAVCIQTSPWFAGLNFSLVTFVFMLLTAFAFDFGYAWNTLLTAAVAAVISYARFRHTVSDIQSKKTINSMNERLIEEKEKLDVSLQKYQYVLMQTNNIVIDWDTQKDEAIFSGNWTDDFDYPMEISGFTRWIQTSAILEGGQRRELTKKIHEAMAAHTQLEMEIALNNKHGVRKWYLLHFVFLRDSDGNIKSGLGYLTDINKHKLELLQLKYQATMDALTGLMNRSAMAEYMESRMALNGPEDMIVMLIIDVDNFKRINDTYGHPCGDKALVEVAGILKHLFRKGDGIGRIGGDEFMVIFSLKNNLPAVRKKLEKLSKSAPDICWGNSCIQLRFSIGAAVCVKDSYESLYKKADQALYMTKQNCKGWYTLDSGEA